MNGRSRWIRPIAACGSTWGIMRFFRDSTAKRSVFIEKKKLPLAYRYGFGAFLARTGRNEEAVSHLEAVAVQQPWHVGAHYNLERALMALGRREEAQRYLEKTDSLR